MVDKSNTNKDEKTDADADAIACTAINPYQLLKEPILHAWIDPQYLHQHILQAVKQAYQDNAFQSIQLRQFLHPRQFALLRANVRQAGLQQELVPDMHSFHRIQYRLAMHQFVNAFRSLPFQQLLSFITGKRVSCTSIDWLSFGHREYTLLHDQLQQKKGVYLMLDFESLDQSAGGFTSIVQSKKGEELGRIIPVENSATLFCLPKDTRYFTKYVNYTVRMKRRIVMVAGFG